MHEITSNLYLSDVNQVGIHSRYERYDIDGVIRLSHGDPKNGYPDDVDVYAYPMEDGPRNDQGTMSEAVDRTATLLDDGKTVVVHCCAGESRSVAVCMASLAVSREVDFSEGWELVESVKPVRAHPDVIDNARIVVRELGGR